jgi:hypothetical protein
MAICRPPVCGPGLVVGVVRLAGREADAAVAILRDPGRLARSLSIPKPSKPRDSTPAARTTASATHLEEGAARGFALTLRRPDGSRPAYGAVLGQRVGPDPRLVLVIGEEFAAVEDAARRVAREHLDSTGVVRPLFSL